MLRNHKTKRVLKDQRSDHGLIGPFDDRCDLTYRMFITGIQNHSFDFILMHGPFYVFGLNIDIRKLFCVLRAF